MEEYSWKRYR